MKNEKSITYFSTFSGIGGFELGIHQATFSGEKSRRAPYNRTHNELKRLAQQQPSCVGFSEVDKYAAKIYQHHFPNHKNYGDITAIDADALPDFDLYVGGFPCQAFSIAGKRAGFNDTRGTLFFDVARILKAKRPKHFLLENVKGLLSHDDGRTFTTIISTLIELGYSVEWQVLNSKDFGVPQNRERVFIVGHLGGKCEHQVFPLQADDREASGLQGQYTNTLTARYEGAQAVGSYIAEGKLNAQVGTLRTHKDGEGFRQVKSGLAPTLNARARQDGSQQGVLKTETSIRRLTPIECERLQGFPDNWTEGVSNTQRYKTLGNAVTVNVIEAVISEMLK